jgi:thiol-disulfide isomerase/thioredoxin
MMEKHYMKRAEFHGENLDYFEDWIDRVKTGKFTQYYEYIEPPKVHVEKIHRLNFKNEVLDSDQDFLLEIYGKYCPSCKFFAPKFDEFAGEMKKKFPGLRVGKLCADHNQIPELVGKKPYTPIFWYYKAGSKDAPVQYEGKNDTFELLKFVRENATFSLE